MGAPVSESSGERFDAYLKMLPRKDRSSRCPGNKGDSSRQGRVAGALSWFTVLARLSEKQVAGHYIKDAWRACLPGRLAN